MFTRGVLLLGIGLLWPTIAHAYIAVNASRLTLNEVMLEFPTVLVLSIEKADAERGAYLGAISDVVQGPRPEKPIRFGLLENGKLATRLSGLKQGSVVVAFLGSPDNRTLLFADGTWFITRPDQGWERFQQFRDDFNALFVGTAKELGSAARTLARGGAVTVAVQPKGVAAATPLFVRYDAQYPHRRWPAMNPQAKELPPATLRTQITSRVPAERQQALVEWAKLPEAERTLRASLTDVQPDVRLAAVVGLGRQAKLAPESVQTLTKSLNDEDRFVCGMAAWALARAGSSAKDALPELLKALSDRNYDHDFRPHRAAEAAEAILTLAPRTPAATKTIEFFLSDRMLNDQRVDSEGTRTAAAKALGRCGSAAEAALPELVKRLRDPLAETRIAAAEAIILIGGEAKSLQEASKVLEAELSKGSVGSRVQAIRAIDVAQVRALRPALQTLTTDAEPELAREAKRVLMQWPTK